MLSTEHAVFLAFKTKYLLSEKHETIRRGTLSKLICESVKKRSENICLSRDQWTRDRLSFAAETRLQILQSVFPPEISCFSRARGTSTHLAILLVICAVVPCVHTSIKRQFQCFPQEILH